MASLDGLICDSQPQRMWTKANMRIAVSIAWLDRRTIQEYILYMCKYRSIHIHTIEIRSSIKAIYNWIYTLIYTRYN